MTKHFSERSINSKKIISDTPQNLDIPLVFKAHPDLIPELSKSLDTVREMQRNIDMIFTREDILQLMKTSPLGCTLHTSDLGETNILYNFDDTAFDYMFLHLVKVDFDHIIKLVSLSVNIPEDRVKQCIALHLKENPRIPKYVIAYICLANNCDLIYHTHINETQYNDASNFVVSLSGKTRLHTSTPPSSLEQNDHSFIVTDLVAINNKKFHAGVSLEDDTWLCYIDCRLTYTELAKYNHLLVSDIQL